MTRTISNFYLFLILFLGFALRIWGFDFGLPQLNHADEPIVVNHALAYGLGDLNPHFFNIPPLTSYLLFIAYGLYFLVGSALQWFSGKEGFLDLFLRDPSSFYYLGRLMIGVLFGLGSIYGTYRLSRRFWSREISLVSAFFMAVLFLPVQVGHFIYPDSPLLFAVTVSLLFYIRIYQKGRFKNYLYAILATGFAIGLKYNAALLIVPFFTAHYLSKNVLKECRKAIVWNWVGIPVLSCLGIGLVFFLVNPFLFLDMGFALKELAEQSHSTGYQGWGHHLFYSLKEGLGLPIFILFLVSFAVYLFLLHRAPYLLIFYAATLVFYLHLVFFAQPYSRYGILLVPQAVFFSMFLLERIFRAIKNRLFIFLILSGLLVIPVYKSLTLDFILSEEDTRNLAREWILKSVPQGSKIFLDHPRFQPRLPYCPEDLEKALKGLSPKSPQALRIEALIASQKDSPCFEVYYPASGDGGKSSEFALSGRKLPFDWLSLKEEGIQYFGLTRLTSNDPDEKVLAFLKEHGKLAARFSPYHDLNQTYSFDRIDLTGAPTTLKDLKSRRRNGHLIEIYQLDK